MELSNYYHSMWVVQSVLAQEFLHVCQTTGSLRLMVYYYSLP